MKKTRISKILLTAAAALMIYCGTVTASAAQQEPPGLIHSQETETQPDEESLEERFSRMADSAGTRRLIQDTPDEARSLLEEIHMDRISFSEMLSLTPKEFFSSLWELVKTTARRPLAMLAVVAGVLFLCALVENFQTALGAGNVDEVYQVVSVLFLSTAVILPMMGCVESTVSSVESCSRFITSFIPVFTGVVTAGGQPATASVYHLLLFGGSQLVSQLVASLLVPALGVYLALCIVAGISPQIKIQPLANAVKSAACWGLGLLLTVFVGLLSVQGAISSGVDSVSSKTAKFLLGNFVPVIGGALSDALSTAKGCLRLLKATVGAYGIGVSVCTFLPSLVQAAAWYAVLSAAGALGEMLGVKNAASLLKSCATVFGILMAVLLLYMLLIVITTTIVLMIGMGL